MLLADCNQEVYDRNAKIMHKMDTKREESGLDKLINVSKKK